jgi:hypothetical protein
LISHTEGRKQPEVRAYVTQGDIWAKGGIVTAEWMKLQNEKIHDPSPNVFRVIKSVGMKQVKH